MKGRKQKPTSIKTLTRNPGKRALNHAEPQPRAVLPRAVLPRAPAHLSDDEKAKWRTLDLDQLALYCVILVRWQKAEKMVRVAAETVSKKRKMYYAWKETETQRREAAGRQPREAGH